MAIARRFVLTNTSRARNSRQTVSDRYILSRVVQTGTRLNVRKSLSLKRFLHDAFTVLLKFLADV